MAVTDNVYDNWGNMHEIDMLYQEGIVTYELETSAGVVYIKEPVQWDAVEFVHKRDSKYHGFNYEFTGPDVDLVFDKYSGREEILEEYASTGNDGLVIFRRKISFGALTIIEYEGKLRLGDMKRQKHALSIPCERKSLHVLINSRLNTKINIESNTDLDDGALPVYINDFISMPGQVLSEKFKADSKVQISNSYTDMRANMTAANMFFTVQDPIYNTLQQTFYPSTLGVSGDPGSHTNDTHTLFLMRSHGIYHFKISMDFQLDLRIHPRFSLGSVSGKKVILAYINVYLRVKRADGVTIDNHLLYAMTPFNPNLQGFHYPRVMFEEELDVDLNEDDSVTLYALVVFQSNQAVLKSTDFVVYESRTIVEVTGTSDSVPSMVQGRLIKSAMDEAMTRITGNTGVVKSDFYSLADIDHPTDGCGANRILTNGGKIRGANTEFPLTFSWSSLLTSMNAIDAIGMGYEWDADEQAETIRVEPKGYFYQDVEVINIGSGAYDYRESVANDQIYNKAKVGYGKYKEEDEDSLNEIHAYHEYQTPIKTESNSYDIISEFIASGLLIEITRRSKFIDDESVATAYDDDVFIVHVKKPDPEFPLWLPVTNEPFDDVTGIASPATTVNMTLSVKRILMAHAKWMTSSLVYKNASDILRNTFTKQNKEFSTTLKSDYCRRGDEALLPLQADADIILSSFGDFTGIYSPEWVYFKVRLSMSEVRMIMNAHRGLDPDGKNYGYITYMDDFDVQRKGWLYELKYNRKTQAVNMTLLKKKFPL